MNELEYYLLPGLWRPVWHHDFYVPAPVTTTCMRLDSAKATMLDAGRWRNTCPSRNGHLFTSVDEWLFTLTIASQVNSSEGPAEEAEEEGLRHWDRSPAYCRVSLDLVEFCHSGDFLFVCLGWLNFFWICAQDLFEGGFEKPFLYAYITGSICVRGLKVTFW
jgi:hypothetical protein